MPLPIQPKIIWIFLVLREKGLLSSKNQPARLTELGENSEDFSHLFKLTQRAQILKNIKIWIFQYFLMINVILLMVGVVGYWKFGSFERTVEVSKGIQRLVSDDTKDLGIVTAEKPHKVTIEFTNQNNKSVKILGFEASCGCEPLEEIPFVLQPYKTRTFDVQITMPPKTGPFKGQINFHTGNRNHPEEVIKVNAEVVELGN